MSDVAKMLSDATVDQLVEELQRRREVVCSIWNRGDVRSLVSEGEACSGLSDEQIELACDTFLERAGRDLQDHLGGQGNFFLGMFWEREGADIVKSVAPAPTF